MSRTITAKKKWFVWLNDNCISHSLKGASLWKMRKTWWGKNAYVARCDGYLFQLEEENFKFLEKNL